MMIRTETTGTLRAYFLFFGFASILVRHGSMREGHEAVWIYLIGLFLGILYVCIGLTLPVLLSRYADVVKLVLLANLSYGSWATLVDGYWGEVQKSPVGVTARLISGVFLTIYVLDNIHRLSAVRPPDGAQDAGNL